MMKARELLEESRASVGHEADWILCHALGSMPLRRSELGLRLDEEVASGVIALTRAQVQRRVSGEPLQYILGTQSFLGHEYRVGPGVLVPRPETEFVWTESVRVLKGMRPQLGYEVGLGSGVLSIELLREFPELRMEATEFLPQARAICEENAATHLGPDGRSRLRVFEPRDALDVCGAFTGRADFLISNPPYLEESDEISTEVLRHEPRAALIPANGDPLHFYRAFAENAPRLLNPRGAMFLEIAHERADEIAQLFLDRFGHVECLSDLTGRPRLLIAQGVRNG
jgi:release factor glutamine methyltransferase